MVWSTVDLCNPEEILTQIDLSLTTMEVGSGRVFLSRGKGQRLSLTLSTILLTGRGKVNSAFLQESLHKSILKLTIVPFQFSFSFKLVDY